MKHTQKNFFQATSHWPRICVLLALALISAAAMLPSQSTAAKKKSSTDARAILDKIDDLYRSQSSKGEITMKITTENWTRTLKMEAWSKGEDKTLIRILSPKKEKGMATLRNGNDIWNYMPKVKRVIKLPSSMMSDSWMGSHFTNDDLVKESRMADDYSYKISFKGTKKKEKVTEISCIPKKDAAVVWGKIKVRVRQKDLMPLKIFYYDEDMHLARTLIFSKIKTMGGRKMPARMTVKPADKPDESTVITYTEMEFDIKLKDDIFSLRNLKK